MKPEECIFFQLAKASQRGLKHCTQAVSGLGVTAVQAMILNFLFEEDKVTSQKLGQKSELDSATLTGVLDRLEAAGLIARKPNPEDRRSIHILLSSKGRGTALQIRKLVGDANEQFLGTLTDQEVGLLKSLLSRIRGQEIRRVPAADRHPVG